MVVKTKKQKEQKMCNKTKLKFNDYKNCLLENKIILKSQQRFKSEAYNIHTEKINKIAKSSNDDKRMQTFDKFTLYPYGTNALILCKNEMLSKYK